MTSGVIIAIAVGLAVLVVFGSVVVRRRGSDDNVETFRRQIDALSPESRRPTIDRGTSPQDDRMKPPSGPATGDDGGDVT